MEKVADIDFAALPPDVQRAGIEADLAEVARGEGAEAVFAYAELLYNVKPAEIHRQWVESFFALLRTAHVSPPESAKTTWGAIITGWSIGKHPWTTNMVLSNGEELAYDIAAGIANKIEFSKKWRLVFPNVIPDKARGWSRDGFEVVDTSIEPRKWARLTATKKDPTLIYGGVGSASVNGRRVTGVLIADDLHNDKSKGSDAECKRVVDFFQDTALLRATETARVWVNQTRWSPNDVIGWIESLSGDYAFKVFHHPAVIYSEEHPEGVSYWPEKRPMELLNTQHSGMIERNWQLIFMGDAKASLGERLKAEYLRDYSHILIRQEWTRYMGVDFAQKLQELTETQARKHSHFAMALLVHTGNILVLEDVFDDLIYGADAVDEFFTWADRHRPARTGIEVNAQNRAFWNDLIRVKIASGRAWLSMTEINTTDNMGARMDIMEHDFKDGTIRVSDEPSPGLKIFRDQWLGFMHKGMRDDTLSAVHLAREVAYNLLPTKSHVERSRKEQKNPYANIGRMNG